MFYTLRWKKQGLTIYLALTWSNKQTCVCTWVYVYGQTPLSIWAALLPMHLRGPTPPTGHWSLIQLPNASIVSSLRQKGQAETCVSLKGSIKISLVDNHCCKWSSSFKWWHKNQLSLQSSNSCLVLEDGAERYWSGDIVSSGLEVHHPWPCDNF